MLSSSLFHKQLALISSFSLGVDNYYNSPSFGFPFFNHFGANFVISKAPVDEKEKKLIFLFVFKRFKNRIPNGAVATIASTEMTRTLFASERISSSEFWARAKSNATGPRAACT